MSTTELSTVTYVKSGLTPHKREVKRFCRQTLAELAPNWEFAFVALVDGKPVLRKDWEVCIWAGHRVVFIDASSIPQGGGGGSNPLQAMAMLAVIALSVYLGPGAGFAADMMFATGIGSAAAWGAVGSAITGAMMLGGMALVNAALPAPTSSPAHNSQASLPQPSPTYSLQAQGNIARIDAAIPEQFGRMLAYPDYWSMPYSEADGNEIYLYQCFCLGRGNYDIEQINVEDTPIDNYEDVEYEIVGPGGRVQLFPIAVSSSSEVSGQDLPGSKAATYTRSGTTVTVSLTAHGHQTGDTIYFAVDTGGAASGAYTITVTNANAFTLTTTTSGTITTSNCHIQSYVGPYVVGPTDTETLSMAWDFAAPKGIWRNIGTGAIYEWTIGVAIEIQPIDDDGDPTNDWHLVESLVYSAATTTPQRYTKKKIVTGGTRYQTRVRRTDVKQETIDYGHDFVWSGCRAYLADNSTLPDVTVVAVRMRASSQLSAQASRKVNILSTRKLPIWDGDSWSTPQPTRSIAWAAAYVCKQVGIPDSQIDLAYLLYLDGIWAARGDECNGRVDNFEPFWDVLGKIADAGRAKRYSQAGMVRFWRDQLQTMAVASFSMLNIVKGSFRARYIMPSEDTADSVSIGYWDASVWKPRRVTCTLEGSTAAKPANKDISFVTSRARAHERGLYEAACNQRRRKIITLQTEMEGFGLSVGDLVNVQHDMPAWGQHGEVIAIATTTNHLLYSGDMSNSWWEKSSLGVALSPVVTANAGTAPDGTATANRIDFRLGGGATSGDVSRVIADRVGSTVIGQSSAQAIWLKTVSGGSVNLTCGQHGEVVTTITVTGQWQKFSSIRSAHTTTSGNMAIRCQGDFTAGADLSILAWHPHRVNGSVNLGPYVGTIDAAKVGVPALTSSEQFSWTAGANHYVGMREKNGSDNGPHLVTRSYPDDDVLVFPDGYGSFSPYSGSDYERTHIKFGPGNAWSQPAIVLSAKPRGQHHVELELVNEDNSVHTADQGVVLPQPVTSQLVGYTAAPTITGLLVRPSSSDPTIMVISWKPSPWAEYYLVDVSQDQETWNRVGEPTATNYHSKALYGNSTYVRVAAVGSARGPWSTPVRYDGDPEYMWVPGDDAEYLWVPGDDSQIMWTT